ncbi:MAG: hypothetical protein NZO58_13700 [Gemmataceae bacterium]|nr:hypothetical protein [Gemmataceae bacterium]
MKVFVALLLALGRGIIKIVVSTLVGFGVAILLIGLTTAGRPEVWERRTPPGELLIGIGAGMLSGGLTLLLLFLVPWLKRSGSPGVVAPLSLVEEAEPVAPRAPRGPRPPLPEAEPPAPPVVVPVRKSPPAEAGDPNFFAKD